MSQTAITAFAYRVDYHGRLEHLHPGDHAVVPLPTTAPDRRTAYNALCAVARRLWGDGNYSLTRDGYRAVHVVRRTDARPAGGAAPEES